MNRSTYRWAAPGDINAFFGLMLDNVADLLLTVGLLHLVFEFPTKFALRHMVPGTALGVLVGDLLFFWLAFRLARQTGRNNVTAMPLGLDTPSTLGMVLFVLGPAFLNAKNQLGLDETAAAAHAWHVGICSLVISGLFKFACSFGSGWIRQILPRAGLLGSLTAIALVLISFLPLVETLHSPVVGLTALAVILTTLVARVPLPFRIPGALGALLIGGSLHYLMQGCGWLEAPPAEIDPAAGLLPTEWLGAFRMEWTSAFSTSLHYLPIVLPFALATVVGGIDCTESAAAAGDEYDTKQVIAVESLATLVAAFCGGVIQTTPYIGHPAYKAMGGRAAYALATAIFVGAAGLLGFFGYLYVIVPKATVFPILVFVGLEITAQSFHATPRRHYAAVALACVPALASLAGIFLDQVIGALTPPGQTPQLPEKLQADVDVLHVLANGFIVTSLLWGSLLAAIVDRRLFRAAILSALSALLTLFGVMHSPLAGNSLFLPWDLAEHDRRLTLGFAGGYLSVALLMTLWGIFFAVWRRAADLPEDEPLDLPPTAD
ncbi:MAG: permease [Pirellulales bacterium]